MQKNKNLVLNRVALSSSGLAFARQLAALSWNTGVGLRIRQHKQLRNPRKGYPECVILWCNTLVLTYTRREDASSLVL